MSQTCVAAQEVQTSSTRKTFWNKLEQGALLFAFFAIVFVFIAVHVLLFTAVHNMFEIRFHDIITGHGEPRSTSEMLKLLWVSKFEWKTY